MLKGLVTEHAAVAGLLAVYIGVGVVVGIELGPRILIPPGGMVSYFGFAVVCYLIWSWWQLVRRGLGSLAAGSELRTDDSYVRNILAASIAFWLHLVAVQSFLQWKSRIPEFNPYSWDERFAEWDRILHLGVAPWEILQPVLGFPVVTLALDKAYVAWFAVLTIVVLWQAFSSDRTTRARFFFTYVVAWIVVGTILGTALSSGGPIFYLALTGQPGGFEPLIAYLEAVDIRSPLQALQLRDVLWANYTQGGVAGVGGIAAMPSLHVGHSVLFAIVGWKSHPVLGWVLGVFAMTVFISTIHLGWHYAIDGYVGGLAVAAIWWLSDYAIVRGGRAVVDGVESANLDRVDRRETSRRHAVDRF